MTGTPRRRCRGLLMRTAAAVLAAGLAAPLLGVSAAHAEEVRAQQWWIEALDLEAAWDITQGEGVTVGIVDSGVDGDHLDVENNVLPGTSVLPGADPDNDGLTDADKELGHGTGMASLVAGHGHGPGNAQGVIGVAPQAEVLPVQAYDDETLAFGDTWNFAEGIRWLADNGADIISLSIIAGPSDELHEAVQYAAVEHGIPIVAGSGNIADDDTSTIYPAAFDEVIAVGGSNLNGQHWDGAVAGGDISVAAPAEDIVSARPDNEYREGADGGTSAATAITAGVLALLKAEHPDESWAELWWRMEYSANTDGFDEIPNDDVGFGIVDPLAGLTAEPGEVPWDVPQPGEDGSAERPGPDDADDSEADDAVLAADSALHSVPLWLWTTMASVAVLTLVATLFLWLRRRRRVNASGSSMSVSRPS